MRSFWKIDSSSLRRWAVWGAVGVLLLLIVVLSSCSNTGTRKFASRGMPPGMGGPMGPVASGAPPMGGPGMPMSRLTAPPPIPSGPGGMEGMATDKQAMQAVQSSEGSAPDMASLEGQTSFPPVGSEESSLLIIKTGDITIKVKSIEEAGNQVIAIARSVGGFVTNSTFSRAEDEESTPFGTVTVRVPVNAFESVTTRIGKIGEVTAKNLNGEDVTGQVFDLESRLRNKRAEETQYVQIMKQAKKIPDIISVSDQLFHVRGEIEQIQGRIKYLRSASDMSSITITLNEPRAATEKGVPGAWQRAIESLTDASVALLSWVIWVVVFAPYWIVIVILLFILIRLVRKRLA